MANIDFHALQNHPKLLFDLIDAAVHLGQPTQGLQAPPNLIMTINLLAEVNDRGWYLDSTGAVLRTGTLSQAVAKHSYFSQFE